jgi:hypothetical protein
MNLKSKGIDLHYELTHHDQLLIATQGTSNIAVFTVHLDQNGAYTFTLHNHIDRPASPNLVTNGQFISLENEIPGWKTQSDPTHESTHAMYQELRTQPNEAYQLSFHYQPLASDIQKNIQVFWGDQLLYQLPCTQQENKRYTFTVEGDLHHDLTKLQFVSVDAQKTVTDTIHDVSLVSSAQNKIPIDFGFLVTDAQGNTTHNHFTVNVTTTPPIELSNHEPVDVIYDQGVYQTIIVNGENPHDNPITRINFDTLFKHLAIPLESRVVEVVQREENGLATNVYEVKISDKSHSLNPITVADVQLSFPGGDGGLAVFHHNVFIEEGSGALPPLDHLVVT